jgi:hypothetical protein
VADRHNLDDAFEEFLRTIQQDGLHPLTIRNLRIRGMFVNSTGNVRVADITPATVDASLGSRRVPAMGARITSRPRDQGDLKQASASRICYFGGA